MNFINLIIKIDELKSFISKIDEMNEKALPNRLKTKKRIQN